jgi:hypothetical protein
VSEIRFSIACGATSPNADTEARYRAMRSEAGFRGDGGCGAVIDFANPIALANVFRCVECGRWMHKRCILAHFEESRHDVLAEAAS